MKTVYSPRHHGHSGNFELFGGEIKPAFEMPSRAEIVLARAKEVGLGDVLAPNEHTLATAAKVHKPDYLAFLPQVYDLWLADGRTGSAIPFTWPIRGLRNDRVPDSIDGKLGFYSMDGGASFVAGTWDAIKSSQDVALTAATLIQQGERAAFALCRPPGHHAGSHFFGGYCYINNIAVAAQHLLDHGAKKVSILDVDYHHGNGTQQIFYARADVQVLNLHGDPMFEYPYFLGHADEIGDGIGRGLNTNYPMPAGTEYAQWSEALDDACQQLAAYKPDIVLVSLGVDTFENDPISQFKLKTSDYPKIGKRIRQLGLPTLFVMEGGYAVAEVGVNAVGVLTGFESQ